MLCAPAVQVYAATHSVDVAERKAGLERAYPVSVSDRPVMRRALLTSVAVPQVGDDVSGL